VGGGSVHTSVGASARRMVTSKDWASTGSSRSPGQYNQSNAMSRHSNRDRESQVRRTPPQDSTVAECHTRMHRRNNRTETPPLPWLPRYSGSLPLTQGRPHSHTRPRPHTTLPSSCVSSTFESLFTFSPFMAYDTHSFVDVRSIAYNKNPDNNTHLLVWVLAVAPAPKACLQLGPAGPTHCAQAASPPRAARSRPRFHAAAKACEGKHTESQ
jgi:hypothetical protein